MGSSYATDVIATARDGDLDGRLLRVAPPAGRIARCAAFQLRPSRWRGCSSRFFADPRGECAVPPAVLSTICSTISGSTQPIRTTTTSIRTEREERLADQFFSLNATKSILFPIDATSRLPARWRLGGDLTRSSPSSDGSSPNSCPHSGIENRPIFHRRHSTCSAASPPITSDCRSEAATGTRSAYRYCSRSRTGSISRLTRAKLAQREQQGIRARDTSIQLSVDYSFGSRGTLYLSGEYRRGDVVSTGPESLVNLDIANVFVADDAYTNPSF